MCPAAQSRSDVLCERPDISPFAALNSDLELRATRREKLKPSHGHSPRPALHFLSSPRVAVEGTPLMFEGTEHGGQLLDFTGELGQDSRHPFGTTGDLATKYRLALGIAGCRGNAQLDGGLVHLVCFQQTTRVLGRFAEAQRE